MLKVTSRWLFHLFPDLRQIRGLADAGTEPRLAAGAVRENRIRFRNGDGGAATRTDAGFAKTVDEALRESTRRFSANDPLRAHAETFFRFLNYGRFAALRTFDPNAEDEE